MKPAGFKRAMFMPLSDWALFVEAWARLALCRPEGSLSPGGGFAPIAAMRPRPSPSPRRVPWGLVDRIADMAALAAVHHVISSNCLAQTWVLCSMLERRGIDARIRVGVRTAGDALSAHCWLEVDGYAVGASAEIAQYFSVLEFLSEGCRGPVD